MKSGWVFVVLAACGGGSDVTGDGGADAPVADGPVAVADGQVADADPDPGACATLSPDPVELGNVVLGTQKTATVTFANACAVPVDVNSFLIAGADASQFAILANTCAGSLAPGASCGATISAAPTSSGAKTATLSTGPTARSVTLSAVGVNLTLEPAVLAFGDAPPGGASGVLALVLTNHEAVDEQIGTATFGGTDPGEFAIVDNTCAATLAAGVSCAIRLQMLPTHLGAFSATLTIGGVTAALTGQGAGNAVAITPTLQDFGTVGIGHASNAVTFTILNTKGLPLPMPAISLGGADASSFLLGATTCTGTLAIGASCTVAVTAVPAQVGARSATLNVMAGASVSATLLVTGISSDDLFTISPMAASFDPDHLVRTFTAVNIGTTDLTPTGIALAGPAPASFEVAATDCTATVHPGGTCTFTIQYLPAAGDARASARLADATGGAVGLAGSATVPTDLTAASLFVDFGNILLGNQATYTISFTNGGTAPTAALALALSGADASSWIVLVDHCTGNALAPSASCTVDAGFRPLQAGARTATLTATAGALAAHANLTGSAIGDGGGFVVAPATHDFGTLPEGMVSAPFTFFFTNDAPYAILAPIVSLGGNAYFNFQISANTCTVDLAAGGTCTVEVDFAPILPGAGTATLSIDGAVSTLFGQDGS